MDMSEKLTAAKKWLLGTRNIDEAEEGIHKSQLLKQTLKSWARRSGKIAVGVLVVAVISKSLPIVIAGGAVLGVYGAIKLAGYLVDKNIEMKQRAELEMHQAEADKNKPAPGLKPAAGPKLSVKVTGSFNAATVPANDAGAAEAPRKSFLSRFGIGT